MSSSSKSSSSVAVVDQGGLRRRKIKKARRNKSIAQALDRSQGDEEKTTYEAQIMYNWECRIENSLPTDLRPALRLANGKRAPHQLVKTKDLAPSDWPTTFKRTLCRLALATGRDLPFAHEQLIKQVKQRQKTAGHHEHYAREALTSDLEAVLANIVKLTRAGRYKPKKAANKVNALFDGVEPHETSDGYEGPSPEERAAASMDVPEKMVKEWLEPDRETQPLEDSWKHLKAMGSTPHAGEGGQQPERGAQDGE